MSSDLPHPPPVARRLSWKEVPWIIVLGVSLSLHLWFPRIDSEPLNDTYSADVGGRNAFFQLAEHRAPYVERNLEPLYRAVDRIDTESVLCLLGPARYPTEREWLGLIDWVDEGGHLLFAARWDDSEVEIPFMNVEVKLNGNVAASTSKSAEKAAEPGATNTDEPKQPDAEQPVAEGPSSTPTAEVSEPNKEPGESGIETTLADPGRLQWKSRGVVVLEDHSDAEVLLRNANGPQVVRVPYGDGAIIVCASDQVFSNSSLFDRKHQNGLLASRLLESAGARRPVVFDESLNASGTPQVVGLLLDPHLRPLTIQTLVLLVVFGWRGGRRFGSLLPKGAAPRHNLTDHTDALGNLYFKTRNGIGALQAYLEQLKRKLRLHLTTERDARTLGPLAQRSGLPVEGVKRLLTEAEALGKRPVVKRGEAAAMIRRLSQLRTSAPRG
jgi:hypothetical protein